MKSYEELLAETKARVDEILAREAVTLSTPSDEVVFLDVRDSQEYNLGKIPGAVTISRGNLELNVERLIPRNKRIVMYCANGNRSAFAAETLSVMGYAKVSCLHNGFSGWLAEGGKVE
jgi:rhodanese-related sulfurtransferase